MSLLYIITVAVNVITVFPSHFSLKCNCFLPHFFKKKSSKCDKGYLGNKRQSRQIKEQNGVKANRRGGGEGTILLLRV